MSAAAEALARRIRSEADIATRPGQMERLEAIADQVSALGARLSAAERRGDKLAEAFTAMAGREPDELDVGE